MEDSEDVQRSVATSKPIFLEILPHLPFREWIEENGVGYDHPKLCDDPRSAGVYLIIYDNGDVFILPCDIIDYNFFEQGIPPLNSSILSHLRKDLFENGVSNSRSFPYDVHEIDIDIKKIAIRVLEMPFRFCTATKEWIPPTKILLSPNKQFIVIKDVIMDDSPSYVIFRFDYKIPSVLKLIYRDSVYPYHDVVFSPDSSSIIAILRRYSSMLFVLNLRAYVTTSSLMYGKTQSSISDLVKDSKSFLRTGHFSTRRFGPLSVFGDPSAPDLGWTSLGVSAATWCNCPMTTTPTKTKGKPRSSSRGEAAITVASEDDPMEIVLPGETVSFSVLSDCLDTKKRPSSTATTGSKGTKATASRSHSSSSRKNTNVVNAAAAAVGAKNVWLGSPSRPLFNLDPSCQNIVTPPSGAQIEPSELNSSFNGDYIAGAACEMCKSVLYKVFVWGRDDSTIGMWDILVAKSNNNSNSNSNGDDGENVLKREEGEGDDSSSKLMTLQGSSSTNIEMMYCFRLIKLDRELVSTRSIIRHESRSDSPSCRVLDLLVAPVHVGIEGIESQTNNSDRISISILMRKLSGSRSAVSGFGVGLGVCVFELSVRPRELISYLRRISSMNEDVLQPPTLPSRLDEKALVSPSNFVWHRVSENPFATVRQFRWGPPFHLGEEWVLGMSIGGSIFEMSRAGIGSWWFPSSAKDISVFCTPTIRHRIFGKDTGGMGGFVVSPSTSNSFRKWNDYSSSHIFARVDTPSRVGGGSGIGLNLDVARNIVAHAGGSESDFESLSHLLSHLGSSSISLLRYVSFRLAIAGCCGYFLLPLRNAGQRSVSDVMTSPKVNTQLSRKIRNATRSTDSDPIPIPVLAFPPKSIEERVIYSGVVDMTIGVQLYRCFCCLQVLSHPRICGRCHSVCYCSEKCQKSHWTKHHKFRCE